MVLGNKIVKPDYVGDVLVVTNGPDKGRICYCDDDDINKTLIICFGQPALSGLNVCAIKTKSVRHANMHDLIERYEEISNLLTRHNFIKDNAWLDEFERSFLYELDLIKTEIWNRDLTARHSKTTQGKKIFLAHSSLDKGFVSRIHTDLTMLGHEPWLDQVDIKVGDSIIEKINSGIGESDFLIFFASPNSINSNWVKAEWESKYWEEMTSGQKKLLVAKINECELPPTLMRKKYANFLSSYEDGLAEILQAVGHKITEEKSEIK